MLKESKTHGNNFPPSISFDDLDKFRDYCRFEGKVFNEADFIQEDAAVWIAYNKYQGWLRAKARQGGKLCPRVNANLTHVTTTTGG